MITVLLIDDQPAIRRGLRMRLALEPDLLVIGEADDGAAAIDLALQLDPQVVVMDIVMGNMDGITATAALRKQVPGSAVVVLSLYEDAAMRERARAAGARAFVGKHEAPEVLPSAIREAAAQATQR